MKIGRNDPCPCGSGLKYKRCCLSKPILLFFGAGASLGSLGIDKIPPSGATLYSELASIEEYRTTWGSIPSEFANLFNESFEKAMNSLYINESLESQYNLANLLADMGIYFSQFPINRQDENLYCRLFNRFRNQIINRRILLSTLNYECLIELALANQGMNKIIYTGDDTGIKLLKLHGSCNFIPTHITRDRQNSRLIIARGTFNTDFHPVEPQEVKESLDKAPFPVMSLYTREKNNIVCPQQIQQIQNEFQLRVKEAKAIITIGIKPDSEDRHIWDHIKQSRAELFMVGNKDDCQGWIAKYRSGNGNFIDNRFDTSFDKICEVINNKLK